MSITTPVTKLLGLKHPIMLAGMGNVAHAELAAAVSNAGGLGVIGGIGFTPKTLRKELEELKELLNPGAPFGVDLLIPQLGGNARKTNVDYTKGKLGELIDLVIEYKAKLFVCAVGVPPKWVVDKLHAAGILVQNMVGHPKHVPKALAAGVDIICAQGSEGGGHTGEIATSVLIPQCVDLCRGKTSPLHGGPVHVVAAGGIYDGRGLAAMLCYGAQAVWVGTLFVSAEESAAGPRHKQQIVDTGSDGTIRTTIYTGRPMRVLKNEHNSDWELNRRDEMQKLQSQGTVPFGWEMNQYVEKGEDFGLAMKIPLLMGQAIGGIRSVRPAAEIVQQMINDACDALKASQAAIQGTSRL